jgi:hypothetical protein
MRLSAPAHPAPHLRTVAVWCLLISSACGALKQEYEYEEELYLRLDGSATVNVNASVAALAALHGAELRVDPQARVDREQVRAFFAGPGAEVSRVSLSRRNGRRFVHVGIEVGDLRQLTQLKPFAWSSYRFAREGDVFEYRQVVGKAAAREVGDVGWTGAELVAFRMHIPSEIPFHNAPSREVSRGHILEWEQPLTARLAGEPIEITVQMAPESILYTTLMLFGSTIVAAALTFAVVIWLVVRKGRRQESTN